jgi:hypothetical protein
MVRSFASEQADHAHLAEWWGRFNFYPNAAEKSMPTAAFDIVLQGRAAVARARRGPVSKPVLMVNSP